MTAHSNTDIPRDQMRAEVDMLAEIITRELDTPTPDQILENWKKRIQVQKGYLVDPRSFYSPPVVVQSPPVLRPLEATPDTPPPQAPEEKAVKAGQTRCGSLLESLVNLLVGYSINFTSNLLIFPLFG